MQLKPVLGPIPPLILQIGYVGAGVYTRHQYSGWLGATEHLAGAFIIGVIVALFKQLFLRGK